MVIANIPEIGQVSLNGVKYGIQGRVQKTLVSQAPPLYRTGTLSEESHPFASIQSWNDQRGGIGIDVMDGRTDQQRCWFSTCSLRHKGHVVLQRLATRTQENGAADAGNYVGKLFDFNSTIYATADTAVRSYNNTTDAWSATLLTTAAAINDALSCPLGGTDTIVVASTRIDWSTNGTDWTTINTNISYLTYWNDLLFGLATTGEFYFTANLANGFTQLTTFKPNLGNPTDLFTGPDREGGEAIYASAEDGLYIYDAASERFYKTQLAVPFHPDNGTGTVAWRNSIYYPAGTAVYQYTPGFSQNVIAVVGPDQDDGLPTVNRGVINKLVTTHNDLIAIVSPISASLQAGAQPFRGATAGPTGHRGTFSGPLSVTVTDNLRGLVLGWDTRGWEVKWEDTADQGIMNAAIVSNAYSEYRLWWAAGRNVYWMAIPRGIENPNRSVTTSFASSGTWESPWFTADVVDFDKHALSVVMDAQNVSQSSGSIVLSFATDYVDSAFTTVATSTGNGEEEWFLSSAGGSSGGSSNDRSGIPFRSFKLRANITRGSTNSSVSPDIKSVALVYHKRVQPLYGFIFNVDMRDNAQGRTPQERRQLLEGLVSNSTSTMVRFGYQGDDDSAGDYWVNVRGVTYLDGTGFDGSDIAQVTVQEIH